MPPSVLHREPTIQFASKTFACCAKPFPQSVFQGSGGISAVRRGAVMQAS